LRPISADHIRIALENILNPDFVEVIERPPALYRGGVPFIIEVAIAYGGQAGRNSAEGKKMEIMRFANRAPLLFDSGGCVITKAVNSVDWKRYELKDAVNAPVTIFVNVVSVHIPYQSAGKQAIAQEEDVMQEIRLAVMDCARRLKMFLHGRKKKYERQKKFDLFMRYIPEVAGALSDLTGKKKEPITKKLSVLVEERLGLEGEEVKGESPEESIATEVAPSEEEVPKGSEEAEESEAPSKVEETKPTKKEKPKEGEKNE
jgi:DNA topoisomerase-6 subunit B